MNCNTQNAKIASITEKTLIVGIMRKDFLHYLAIDNITDN